SDRRKRCNPRRPPQEPDTPTAGSPFHNRRSAGSWIVIVDFGEVAFRVLEQSPSGVFLEDLAVGEAVADSDELVERHVDLAEDLFDRFVEVGPGEFAIVAADESQTLSPCEPASAYMGCNDVGGASEPELQKF